jgi:hypothetical protein
VPGIETGTSGSVARSSAHETIKAVNCTHEDEWTPFQTHYFSQNLVVPGIETGTSGSVARNSDHQTTEAVNCAHEAEWTPFEIHYFSEIWYLRQSNPDLRISSQELCPVA